MRVVNPALGVFFAVGLPLLTACPDPPRPATQPHRCHLVRRIPRAPRLVRLDGRALEEVARCADVRCFFAGAIHDRPGELRLAHPRWSWVNKPRMAFDETPIDNHDLLAFPQRESFVVLDAKTETLHRIPATGWSSREFFGLYRSGATIFTVLAPRDGAISAHVLVPGDRPPPDGVIPFEDAGTVAHDGRVLDIRWPDGREERPEVRGRLRQVLHFDDTLVVRFDAPDAVYFFGHRRGALPGVQCATVRTDGESVVCVDPTRGVRELRPSGPTPWSGLQRDLRGQPLPDGVRRTTARVASDKHELYFIEELQDATCQIRSRVYRGISGPPVLEVEGALLRPAVDDRAFYAVRVDVSLVPIGD